MNFDFGSLSLFFFNRRAKIKVHAGRRLRVLGISLYFCCIPSFLIHNFLIYIYIYIYIYIIFNFYSLTLNLLGIEIYNFFNLIFMRLSWITG